jgi:hypothetical protein
MDWMVRTCGAAFVAQAEPALRRYPEEPLLCEVDGAVFAVEGEAAESERAHTE